MLTSLTRAFGPWMCLLVVITLFTPVAWAQEDEEEEQEAPVAAAVEAGDDDDDETEGDEDTEDEDDAEKPRLSSSALSILKWRSIGPAVASGRVGDLAVNPDNHSEFYVAVSSGGVWKTTNAGTTFSPVFDSQASYSIGCITLDPNDADVVWVGSGENNSQRSVSFGDGVYVSRDGGRKWKNVGLKESEHIGMIVVDPRDSNVVYVAAQGPLWRSGGDRGLYKTTDGGKTWERVLHVSDDTGINEVHMDPRNPDVLYASAYQRRRHVWTLINGGPESGVYKSIDAGVTWKKINRGLPGGDKGRIGLDIAPGDPDVIYAIVEATGDSGGFYRSTNGGTSWSRRNSIMTSSPQYYNEIVCDPHDVDRVYLMDTFLHVTEDGGKTWNRTPRADRHVDDHALWIDPDDPDHLLVGCDGGLYESFDRGRAWDYAENLPVTQFYRVAVDNSEPFYYVYGGTQDNATLGGPSRTTSRGGITSEDWFVTVGGDGFETQVDPTDPNIVYSQWQHGGLIRHDRRSGEVVDIKPREEPGEVPYRWNWDSPLLISPHDPSRIYFGANRLFRSDDKGNGWTAISGDLTRQIDRNTLEVMGRIQKADAVAKHMSTSIYGNLVALSESPLVEGLIYVGTDDGLIQVTEDGGGSWRKIDTFPGIPDLTYVSCVEASLHDADTVYATFDNHKMGDFAPYVLVSRDRGATWESITGDLPERHIVYTLREDHVKSDLLFVATEFGVFCTLDGGGAWMELKGGLPTISVKDLEVQRRENDLVIATFGRGFYVLDDYAMLRTITEEQLHEPAIILPIRTALQFPQRSRLGGRSGRGSQGATYFNLANPPYGAVITYHMGETFKTRKQLRAEQEKEDETFHPTIEELRQEAQEVTPAVILTIRDTDGNIVRRLNGSRNKGMHRATWDLRHPAATPIRVSGGNDNPWGSSPSGPPVIPGTYTVTVSSLINGVITDLAGPESFEVKALDLSTFAAKDKAAVLAFHQRVVELQRVVQGTSRAADEARERIRHLQQAALQTPGGEGLLEDLHRLQAEMTAIMTKMRGDRTLRQRQAPTPPSINSRLGMIAGSWNVTSPPTRTQRDGYRYAATEFAGVYDALKQMILVDIPSIERQLERIDAPWTPGRLPDWTLDGALR